jgi:hypothetical protein
MIGRESVLLNEQLMELLHTLVEETWQSLTRDQRISKDEMVRRVFDAAENGERDPEKLREIARDAASKR